MKMSLKKSASPTTCRNSYLKRRTDLTQELLKEILHYNPSTGVFTWLNPRAPRMKPGDTAGSLHEGYVKVKISQFGYSAHRLAFLYMEGRWPRSGDHWNGEPSDNRWNNLRDSTQMQNCYNRKTLNSTGYPGVTRDKRLKNLFVARVTADRVRKYLGTFTTAEAAAAAVVQAKKSLHKQYSINERSSAEVELEIIAD